MVALLGGCDPAKKTAEPDKAPPKDDARAAVARAGDAGSADVALDAAPADAGPPKKVFVHGSGRCGECHGKMFDEWETSAHARAASSPLYKRAVADAADATCDRCHAPLAAHVARDGVASEGVTCDVCHTLREPAPAAGGGGFRLAVDDMVKFGPRCDLEDHYFHRMGCSPEHREARLCGACHWWEPRGLPVLTEYPDWRDGPKGKAGVACQHCHMPKEKGVIATGSPARTGVPHHGLLGLATDLRKRALALAVEVEDRDGAVHVRAAVTNASAGHALPAGLPERRLVVAIRVTDDKGAEVRTEHRYLGRRLVDAAGAEVPFWRASRVAEDTRIAPGQTWSDEVSFAIPGAGAVEVEVTYRGLSPAIAKRLGVDDVEEHALVRARVPFGAARTGGRARLPRKVIVKPPPAGKRPR